MTRQHLIALVRQSFETQPPPPLTPNQEEVLRSLGTIVASGKQAA